MKNNILEKNVSILYYLKYFLSNTYYFLSINLNDILNGLFEIILGAKPLILSIFLWIPISNTVRYMPHKRVHICHERAKRYNNVNVL